MPRRLRLQSGSPRIDTGNNDADTDGSVVSVPAFREAETDVSSSLRLVDGDADSTATLDMGAHEIIPPAAIVEWRSMRDHNGTWLKIHLDPDACGDGSGGVVSESRKHGIQKIEIEFDTPVDPVDGTLTTDDVSVSDGTNDYTPDDIELNEDHDLMTIWFDTNPLPDQTCYTVDIAGAVQARDPTEDLEDDTDCAVRCLEGDVNFDGNVNLIDAAEVKVKNGQSPSTGDYSKYDDNVDGNINLIDFAEVKVRNGHSAQCPACVGGGLMMLAGFGMGAGATLVEHTTGESEIVLPAEGGTVVVDLVIDHPGAVVGYEGRLAVDAADVVSVDSADWTATDNVLLSLGEPGHDLASYFDLLLMDWYLVYDDGTVAFGNDAEDLDDPDVVDVFTDGLDLSALDGDIDADWGSIYVTGATIGGLTPGITTSGADAVAVLTLEVAAVEGTYEVSFVDGYIIDTNGQSVPVLSGTALEITVGGE